MIDEESDVTHYPLHGTFDAPVVTSIQVGENSIFIFERCIVERCRCAQAVQLR